MSCCDIPMPDYSKIPCWETQPLFETIRVYRRIPRKMKKRLKKPAQSYDALKRIINHYSITDEPLSNYPTAVFDNGGVYQFEKFRGELKQ